MGNKQGGDKLGTWNDRLIDKLKQLWTEGKSAREIGEALGVGKNAVIGKAHRLGLDQRLSPIQKSVKKGEKRPNKTPAHVKIKELMQTPRSPTPYMGPNTLANLALDQCRYTSSTLKPFVFCARPITVDGPYCAEHRAICYISQGKRSAHEASAWKPWKQWS